MLDFGTRVVGGWTPGKGGGEVLDVPVFDTVVESFGDLPETARRIIIANSELRIVGRRWGVATGHFGADRSTLLLLGSLMQASTGLAKPCG